MASTARRLEQAEGRREFFETRHHGENYYRDIVLNGKKSCEIVSISTLETPHTQ